MAFRFLALHNARCVVAVRESRVFRVLEVGARQRTPVFRRGARRREHQNDRVAILRVSAGEGVNDVRRHGAVFGGLHQALGVLVGAVILEDDSVLAGHADSGHEAVVEGVGDHGCEYMTGGRVVVLGPTGKNFAAGMSGGVAYVLDENSDLYLKLNKELVSSEIVSDKYDVLELKEMIEEHVAATGSKRGKEILDNFSEYLPKFKKIISYDYSKMLQLIAKMEEHGLGYEQAQIEAFYAHKKQA